MRRLLHLAGVDSLDRNLVSEDKEVWHEEEPDGEGGEEDDMRILAARDVIMTTAQKANPAAEAKNGSLARKLLPLAMAAGLGAGGLWLANSWPPFDWSVPNSNYEVRFYNSDGELIDVPRHAE